MGWGADLYEVENASITEVGPPHAVINLGPQIQWTWEQWTCEQHGFELPGSALLGGHPRVVQESTVVH